VCELSFLFQCFIVFKIIMATHQTGTYSAALLEAMASNHTTLRDSLSELHAAADLKSIAAAAASAAAALSGSSSTSSAKAQGDQHQQTAVRSVSGEHEVRKNTYLCYEFFFITFLEFNDLILRDFIFVQVNLLAGGGEVEGAGEEEGALNSSMRDDSMVINNTTEVPFATRCFVNLWLLIAHPYHLS
jgi:hypothetical protein